MLTTIVVESVASCSFSIVETEPSTNAIPISCSIADTNPSTGGFVSNAHTIVEQLYLAAYSIIESKFEILDSPSLSQVPPPNMPGPSSLYHPYRTPLKRPHLRHRRRALLQSAPETHHWCAFMRYMIPSDGARVLEKTAACK